MVNFKFCLVRRFATNTASVLVSFEYHEAKPFRNHSASSSSTLSHEVERASRNPRLSQQFCQWKTRSKLLFRNAVKSEERMYEVPNEFCEVFWSRRCFINYLLSQSSRKSVVILPPIVNDIFKKNVFDTDLVFNQTAFLAG